MKWTKEQSKFLSDNYPIYGGKYCAKQLNLTWRQINSKAFSLKLKMASETNVRICSKCLVPKFFVEFPKDPKAKLGISRWCKACCQKRNIVYYSCHKNKFKTYARCQRVRDIATNSPRLIIQRLRCRTRKALRGIGKISSTLHLLGCSKEDFIKYLKSKLKSNMSWEDVMRGRIHIDHIRPCASFDFTNPEEQKLCFHYTNLQLLWAKDNISKGDKLCLTAL